MQAAFDQLDVEINPNFKYVANDKKYEEEKEHGQV